jgi:type II secretory pathway predicted ATPase ExeA
MKTTDHVDIKSYFAFNHMPFTKYMWSNKMFDSPAQAELLRGLHLFVDNHGICVVHGANGIGKSIAIRRFQSELDEKRYHVFYIWNQRLTPLGFIRSLARKLGIIPKVYLADTFDELSRFLYDYESRTGRHPILVFDNAEGLSHENIECLRLLTNFEMDSTDKCSLILIGTDEMWNMVARPENRCFHQCVTFSHTLRAFSHDETKQYFDFHLDRSEGPKDLFSQGAVKYIFNLAKGIPRVINQIATQALIRAVVRKVHNIDDAFLKVHVIPHTFYDLKDGPPEKKEE